MPATIFLTDDFGTISLINNQSCNPGPYTWSGGRTLSSITVRNDFEPGCAAVTTTTGTLGIEYVLICNASTWTVSRNWLYCFPGSVHYYVNSFYDNTISGCLNAYSHTDCCWETRSVETSFTTFSALNCNSFSFSGNFGSGGGLSNDPFPTKAISLSR